MYGPLCGSAKWERSAQRTLQNRSLPCFVASRTWSSLRLPPLPGQPGTVHADLYQSLVFDLGDVHRSAIRSAKAEVAGRWAEHIDLAQHFALRRQFDYRALAVARHIEIAVHVAAH